jgi:hypothetical protein
MASGSHLRAGEFLPFAGGTFGATLSLRALTEIEPTAGCVESWPSQPLATATMTKTHPVHNFICELTTIVRLRFARRMKANAIGHRGTIIARHRVESTERLTKIW